MKNLAKLICIVMALSMVMSLMTACTSNTTFGSQADDRTALTTRQTETGLMPDISEPNQTSQTTRTTKAGKDYSGKYTYTVYAGTKYETTLSMDINIDDYLINNGEKSLFFSTGYICEALGWNMNGDPNFDGSSSLKYFAYVYGETQMVFEYNIRYADKESNQNKTGYPQLQSFDYHLAPISDYRKYARTLEETRSSALNYGIVVHFQKHYDDVCYHTAAGGNGTVGISRDDAIIIAYVFSAAITRPGENPFVGTNLEKAQIKTDYSYRNIDPDYHLVYKLP